MTRDPGIAAHPLGPGTMLQLIREADGTTRADLSAVTGLARSTIAQRLEQLRSQGLLRELGESDSTGGRPPMMLAFNEDAGVVLAADLGATHSRLAVTNLGGTVLAEESGDMAIAAGPEAVLDWADERFHAPARRDRPRRRRRARDRDRGPGPGRARDRAAAQPADHARAGTATRSPSGSPTATGSRCWSTTTSTSWPSASTGPTGARSTTCCSSRSPPGSAAGSSSTAASTAGADGAAGDIGHIRVAADGGRGDHLQLRQRRLPRGARRRRGDGAAADATDGVEAADSRAVVELARAGEPAAVQLVRDSGRLIGEVLAASVNLYNPSVIVIGGDVAQAHEQLLAGVREVVYQRSLPLATRHLRIVRSRLADRAGVIGAAVMVIERVLSPAAIDAAIAAAPPRERGAREAELRPGLRRAQRSSSSSADFAASRAWSARPWRSIGSRPSGPSAAAPHEALTRPLAEPGGGDVVGKAAGRGLGAREVGLGHQHRELVAADPERVVGEAGAREQLGDAAAGRRRPPDGRARR